MKTLLIGFGYIVSLCVHAAELDTSLLESAQKCGDAGIAKDWEKIVAYMPPRIVEAMGGKAAVVEATCKATEEMAKQGVAVTKAKPFKPVEKKEINGTIYAVIPQEIEMKVPQGVLRQKAFMLGISKPPGTVWHFVSITRDNEKDLMEMFPDLLGGIVLPSPEKPILVRP